MKFRLRGDSRRISAAEINRWNALANQQARGEQQKILTPTVRSHDPSSRVGLVKNTSGSDRAAHDCMSVDGLVWDLELDGTSGVILKLITADPDKAPAVLLEPIADGAIGRAVLDGLAIAKVGGGSGLSGVPNAANHRINPGSDGSIKLLAPPHADNVTLLPVILNSAAAASASESKSIRFFLSDPPPAEGGTVDLKFLPGTFGRDNWDAALGTITEGNRFRFLQPGVYALDATFVFRIGNPPNDGNPDSFLTKSKLASGRLKVHTVSGGGSAVIGEQGVGGEVKDLFEFSAAPEINSYITATEKFSYRNFRTTFSIHTRIEVEEAPIDITIEMTVVNAPIDPGDSPLYLALRHGYGTWRYLAFP
jgi:hypothetical protein